MALNLTRFQQIAIQTDVAQSSGMAVLLPSTISKISFFTESSCSNLPVQLWILTEMSLYCYRKSDLGWVIHCALSTLFWHLSTICTICLILKMHRSTALKAHAKHHVFVNDCIPWILSSSCWFLLSVCCCFHGKDRCLIILHAFCLHWVVLVLFVISLLAVDS